MGCYTGVLLARIKLYLQTCTPTVFKTLPAWFLLNYDFSAYYIISMFNFAVKFWQHPKINPGSAPGNQEFYSQHKSIDWFQMICAANRIPGCYMIWASVEIKKSWEASIFRYFEKSRETWSILYFFHIHFIFLI